MQAESGAALVAAGGKERVEGRALHVRCHAGAVVGKDDLDVVMAAGAGGNRDGSGAPVAESMVNGVEEQIGQDLPIGARIAVDGQSFGDVDGELDRRPLQ